MNRRRAVAGAALVTLGFFAVIGVVALFFVGHCTHAGTVCTIEGQR